MSKKIDINQAVKYLSHEGPLAKENPDFEERTAQLELVKNISECFNENKIGVFEAGTGVGKSFAYLIPALIWAKENNQRIVISTGTINLQQQIAEKDIIQAQKILGTNEKFLLLKGRQNYVCQRRLKDLEDEKDLFFEEEEELKIFAEQELSGQLKELLRGKCSEHILVVGLGNREVTADAIGPLTVDSLLVTRHFFQEEQVGAAVAKKYRKVSAFAPGVTAQTGVETMELIRGIVDQIKPDIVLAVDALAARSPKRLNTTIQLTDTGISPGAGVGNNRKELNETSLGCPVIAIGVPTVLDAVTIAKEDVSEDVKAFFVMPRNIDSSVQYVSELLAGGINRVNQKNGI